LDSSTVDGELLRQMILAAQASLEQNKERVNALNVFPVPDGDTGTNMFLTISAAVREVNKARGGTVGEIAHAISMGSLMGARGNSGVILSQLFRGFARAMEGKIVINSMDFARALQEGVDTAYRAVMRPVEGTLLTVARSAARAAVAAARRGAAMREVLEGAIRSAQDTLSHTPDMLPVLRQAGVVDAGGQGFIYVLSGYMNAVQNQSLLDSPDISDLALAAAATPQPATAPVIEFQVTDEISDIKFIYDTELLLRGRALPSDEIRRQLGEIGDSVLVVGDPSLLKIHVHTNHPGEAIERCLKHGELVEFVIKNMREQHEALLERAGTQARMGAAAPGTADRARQEGAAPVRPTLTGTDKAYGIVSVAAGQGLAEIMKSLGADVIVGGGDTMNPSAAELLAAVEEVPARVVFVLPNNKNVIMAAQQVQALTQKDVRVVPTRTVVQGLAALLASNPKESVDDNYARLTKAIDGVKSGEITYAVRAAKWEHGDIRAGDILGLWEDRIVAVGRDIADVAIALIRLMIGKDSSVLSLYYGEDVTAAQAENLGATLQAMFPDVEVEVHAGGQPLYYYYISVE